MEEGGRGWGRVQIAYRPLNIEKDVGLEEGVVVEGRVWPLENAIAVQELPFVKMVGGKLPYLWVHPILCIGGFGLSRGGRGGKKDRDATLGIAFGRASLTGICLDCYLPGQEWDETRRKREMKRDYRRQGEVVCT